MGHLNIFEPQYWGSDDLTNKRQGLKEKVIDIQATNMVIQLRTL